MAVNRFADNGNLIFLRNGVILRKAAVHGLATPLSEVVVPLLAAASDGPG